LNIPRLELGDTLTDRLYDAAELVSQDVALLQLHDRAVQQVEI